MRSALFNTAFWATSAGFVFALAPLSLLPGDKAIKGAIRAYARSVRFLMKHVAGITIDMRGLERLPKGPFIIAAKHQSYGDGFAMVSHFDDLAFVTGDHLERFPLVGGILKKIGAIVVDNCGGHEARKRLATSFEDAARDGRPVLIYPEGHLSKVGEAHRYRSGVWHMQQACNWPVVPVATNLGLFWQCEDPLKTPGAAINEFLDPIMPGMDKDAFLAQLEQTIEGHTARLVAEGRVGLRERAGEAKQHVLA
jgi:1-acyl-sn-glycerol-3-phosphate acyltransferase